MQIYVCVKKNEHTKEEPKLGTIRQTLFSLYRIETAFVNSSVSECPTNVHMSSRYIHSLFVQVCDWDVGDYKDMKGSLSIMWSSWFLHAVHGVVRHQSKRWHLSWYAGGREHTTDVRGRVNILTVFHLVCWALPVDMEAGDAGVGSQNIPLELQWWKTISENCQNWILSFFFRAKVDYLLSKRLGTNIEKTCLLKIWPLQ